MKKEDKPAVKPAVEDDGLDYKPKNAQEEAYMKEARKQVAKSKTVKK